MAGVGPADHRWLRGRLGQQPVTLAGLAERLEACRLRAVTRVRDRPVHLSEAPDVVARYEADRAGELPKLTKIADLDRAVRQPDDPLGSLGRGAPRGRPHRGVYAAPRVPGAQLGAGDPAGGGIGERVDPVARARPRGLRDDPHPPQQRHEVTLGARRAPRDRHPLADVGHPRVLALRRDLALGPADPPPLPGDRLVVCEGAEAVLGRYALQGPLESPRVGVAQAPPVSRLVLLTTTWAWRTRPSLSSW